MKIKREKVLLFFDDCMDKVSRFMNETKGFDKFKVATDQDYKIAQQLYQGLRHKADFVEKDLSKLADDAVAVGL